MDVYAAIFSRRTVRDFQEREIDRALIKKILEAGLHAPSNDHLRQWEFVLVQDRATRLAVIEKIRSNRTEQDAVAVIDNWGLVDQAQRAMYLDAIPKQYRMLFTAGSLILPCFRQKSPLLQPKDLSALNPFASIWCCIENILLAATAEGIYGVTRIPDGEESAHLKTVLHIPEDYAIPCYLALGYPAENAKRIEQLSINIEERIHFNQW